MIFGIFLSEGAMFCQAGAQSSFIPRLPTGLLSLLSPGCWVIDSLKLKDPCRSWQKSINVAHLCQLLQAKDALILFDVCFHGGKHRVVKVRECCQEKCLVIEVVQCLTYHGTGSGVLPSFACAAV